jgi:hypothetical protein
MTPESFATLFSAAFLAKDGAGLAAYLSDDADVVTLTGGHAENALDARRLFEAEFTGALAATRLVSGKSRIRPLGPGGAVLIQRFVVIGARDVTGSELPRFGAVLLAVILARTDGWSAVSLSFAALNQ